MNAPPYANKEDLNPCMKQKVAEFDDFFVPGTVLISEKASYRLRVGYLWNEPLHF